MFDAMLSTQRGSPTRLLVVDDDPLVLEVLQLAFEMEGFAVSTASDAESALAAAEPTPPDGAVLDMQLPGDNGASLAVRLRHLHGSDWPVVFVSADIHLAETARRIGAPYVPKPFDLDVLIDTVQRAVCRQVPARADV